MEADWDILTRVVLTFDLSLATFELSLATFDLSLTNFDLSLATSDLWLWTNKNNNNVTIIGENLNNGGWRTMSMFEKYQILI